MISPRTHRLLCPTRPLSRAGGRPRNCCKHGSSYGVYKSECIRTSISHQGPYKTISDVEYATAGWDHWYNNRRLHGNLGMISPNEFEADHYAALNRELQPA